MRNTDNDLNENGTVKTSDELTVKAEEYLEVISTEDERIKIIGEELANDTGRAIFGKISQGIVTPNELAKALNISLPLINWHINRLLSVGLVKVDKIEMSSKNKEMKYYGPVKTALVIVPPQNSANGENSANARKESVLLKLRQYLASFVALMVGAPIIYAIEKSVSSSQTPATMPQAEIPNTVMKSTEPLRSAAQAVPIPATPVIDEPTMILLALVGGTIIAVAVFFIMRFYLKRKKINQFSSQKN